MAYEIGAELTNMEFMQIGMGFSWPVVNIFNGYIWEGKPSLKDKDGNDIFENVLPYLGIERTVTETPSGENRADGVD